MESLSFIVPPPGRLRLDHFLALQLAGIYSRSLIQKWIRSGDVHLNDETARPNDKVKSGDRITLTIPNITPLALQPEAIELDVLFEDTDLIVINKPPGMVVHPGAGNLEHTLVHALLSHCKGELSGIGGIERPGIVHRLDKDTSGCLIAAKNDITHQKLSHQFQSRSVEKHYQALCMGRISSDSFSINAPIGRHPVNRQKMAVDLEQGREALTDVKVLKRFTHHTYVQCQIHTGRTHQIRVHLAYKGFPILGDTMYGRSRSKPSGSQPRRQLLHSWRLAFLHPHTEKRVEFTAPLPDDFVDTLETLSHD